MSELSIHELQAEQVELLPERETLGAFVISEVGVAEASQVFAIDSINIASVSQHVNVFALGSFNTHNTHVFAL